MILASLLCAAAVPGCLDPATRAQMAKSDSILGAIKTQPTPRDAAAWATDPYDADKKARGTTLVLNAPFGGADAWLALYREYLTDPSPGVRASAARGLGLHGSPEDVPLIVPMLKDKEKSVRLDAVKALQRLHNPVAIAPLIAAMDSQKEVEPDVRAEAASALGQYPENRVLGALIAALADDQLIVSNSAWSSLRTLTGNETLSDDHKSWTNWAKDTKTPFANQRPYYYPVFRRDAIWTDYIPIIGGKAPNEQTAQPAGMPAIAGNEAAAK
jgi:hypothetical protein